MKSKFTSNPILILLLLAFLMLSCKNDTKANNTNIDNEINLDEAKTNEMFLNTLQTGEPVEEDEVMTGSFILDDDDRYQAVYSSQNYETFYELYAKPIFDGDYLTDIKFRIVNYKGPVDIGFVDLEQTKNELKYSKKDKTLRLSLLVKGLPLKSNITKTLALKNKIHKDSIKRFNVYRTLIPMTGVGDTNAMYLGVFDNEFFYRSGLGKPVERELKPGHYGYKHPKSENNSMVDYTHDIADKEVIIILGKDSNCHTSTLVVKN